MAHPMQRLVNRNLGHAQLGGFFDDVFNKLDDSLKSGLDKAKNDAITNTLKTLVGNPTVQTAIVESGNDAAISNLAAQLKSMQNTAIATVKKNPYTTMIVIGGLSISAIALFFFLTRRR